MPLFPARRPPPHADGRVAVRDSRILRREPSGALALHADVSAFTGGLLNDMVVDGRGRAYVGNFGFDLMGGAAPASAALVRVDPDGAATVAAEDLRFPNGAVLTPDGRTLIVAETFGNRIAAFDVADDGTLGPRRDWARFGDVPESDSYAGLMSQVVICPDGVGLDAEGALWLADAIGSRLLRVREGGEVAEEIAIPSGGVFACMLGGADGRTLFACVAPDFHEAKRMVAKEGSVVAIRVDVPHAGRP